jgi:hypothetical protein
MERETFHPVLHDAEECGDQPPGARYRWASPDGRLPVWVLVALGTGKALGIAAQ